MIIRRLVGISHTADFDKLGDADVRAACERRALRFGRALLVGPSHFFTVEALAAAAAHEAKA